jgi:hypothetical protein
VPDDAAYKHAWQAVADYYRQQHGVTWDPSGKDICRLCFVSWDPALYLNPEAQPFSVAARGTTAPRPPIAPPQYAMSSDRRDYYARQALTTAARILATSSPGNRHHARTKAAYLLGGYVAGGLLSLEEARAALAVAVARNTAHFERSMQTIDACLAAGMQAAISLEELERERRAWLARHWHTRARRWTGTLATIGAEEGRAWQE